MIEMPVRISTHDWPYVVTTIEGEMDEEGTRDYLARFITDVVARRAPFVSIVDTTHMAGAPSAKVRRMIADWEAANSDVGVRWNLGVAYISTSTLVRGAMTALHWISPPKVPTEVFANMAAARTWASKRFEDGMKGERGTLLSR